MRRSVSGWLCAAIVFPCAGFLLAAQDSSSPPAHDAAAAPTHAHIVIKPEEVKWTPGPPGLPRGAMLCVLDGDPSKAGSFTFRAKVPAGFVVPSHWHSCDENITVLSGKFNIGDGDQVDKTGATTLTAGGFTKMPAKMHHFAFCDEETTIQVHGVGPFDITYINPADDPRKQEEKK